MSPAFVSAFLVPPGDPLLADSESDLPEPRTPAAEEEWLLDVDVPAEPRGVSPDAEGVVAGSVFLVDGLDVGVLVTFPVTAPWLEVVASSAGSP